MGSATKRKRLRQLTKARSRALRNVRNYLDTTSLTQTRSLYKPLDEERKEIRLLLLKAGSHSQPLQCELQQAFLTTDPKPSYETISYTWGKGRKTSEISLNGLLKPVRSSAEKALRRMRLPDADRVLWIDSICINQDEPEERGHQVGIMYEIYSNTQRNLVWLGEDDGTVAEALKLLKMVLLEAGSETNHFEAFGETIRRSDGYLRYASHGLNIKADLEPLRCLYSRPWFRRLWVRTSSIKSPEAAH